MFGQMIQQLQNADTFSLTGRIENIVGMIDGDGFFLTGDKPAATTNAETPPKTTLTETDPQNLELSRVGDFKFDSQGYLVDGRGNVVYGFVTYTTATNNTMNISLGSSATAVSNLLDHRVEITTPRVSVSEVKDFNISDLEPAIGVEIRYISGLVGSNIMQSAVELFIECFVLAVKLAVPILAAELLGQIGMGVLMKVIPQINVFAINIELKMIIGLGLMLLFMSPISEFLLKAENEMLLAVRDTLTTLAP